MEEYIRKSTIYDRTKEEPEVIGSHTQIPLYSKSPLMKSLDPSSGVASDQNKAAIGAPSTSRVKNLLSRFTQPPSTDASERLLRLNTIALILTLITTLMSLLLLAYLAIGLR